MTDSPETSPPSPPGRAVASPIHRTWASLTRFFRSQFSNRDGRFVSASTQDICVSSTQSASHNFLKPTAFRMESSAPGLPYPWSKNSRLPHIFEIPQFPETSEDAADLLDFIRSYKEERNCRKLAAEHILFQAIIHLKVLKRKACHDRSLYPDMATLRVVQRRIPELDEALSEADRVVGFVRVLLHRGGFRAGLYPKTLFTRNDLSNDP